MGGPHPEDYSSDIGSKLRSKVGRDIWADMADSWGWFFSETKTIKEDSKIGPNVSIEVDGKKATVEMELAGYAKKDVSITTEGETLRVSGTRAKANFVKTFRVATDKFDIDSASVKLKDGLLTITLDRLTDVKTEKRTVPIQ